MDDNEPKKMNEDPMPPDEDDIIELVDAIENDDEIIDLVEPLEGTVDLEHDEELIDLTDTVDEIAAPHPDDFDLAPEATAGAEPEGDKPREDLHYGDAFEEDIETDEESDDFVHSLGMDLESDIDMVEDEQEEAVLPVEDALAGSISTEQIESAVERVLMRILPEKIEGILVEAIERIVSQEIKKIKSELLDE